MEDSTPHRDPGRGRALWLIDAGYLFEARHSVRRGYEFSYLSLRRRIERNGKIYQVYFLNTVPSPVSPPQESFYAWLESPLPHGPGFTVKTYPIKRRPLADVFCEHCRAKVRAQCPQTDDPAAHRLNVDRQKGVDVGIATLALIHAADYDTLVLSSGDGDLKDAIAHLKGQGKRFELVVFRHGLSPDLVRLADRVTYIGDFAPDVAMR